MPLSAPVLHQSYAEALPELSAPCRADVPPDPRIVWLDEELARELGLDPEQLRSAEGIDLLTGQIEGTTAQAYAGHQFGTRVPVLGDGRAVLLGDLVAPDGTRRDLHLKGAGRTPFARGGDGKAPLGPMLREAVIGRWLHALGVPTSRILAVLTTGERIQPRRGITPEVGAAAVRVAASHLRVGTFQYAAWHHGPDVLRRLTDYAIRRHHPEADGPLGLLGAVAAAQAELVAQWMLAGFVHGVMNTDNMTISGEGIDYGPCAVLDAHRRDAVFSSIDTGGRYAYGNQPGVALWNLARFADALLPLVDGDAVERATAVLLQYEDWFRAAHRRGLAARLGVEEVPEELAAELDDLLEGRDHTATFRALGEGGVPDGFEGWVERLGPRQPVTNPLYAPRNEQLETALRAAELGNREPILEILDAVGSPSERVPGREHLEQPGGDGFVTFCGT